MTDELTARVRDGYLALLDRPEDPLELIGEVVRREAPLLAPDDARALVDRVAAQVAGLGEIDDLWRDPTVNDILVNGPGRVWVERGGRLAVTDVALDRSGVERLVDRTLGLTGVRVDRARPVGDGRLPDGTRVSVVLPPIAPDGPLVAIRRFADRPVGLGQFGAGDVVALLEQAVIERRNIVVFGGTGAGKTTLLGALGEHAPPAERVLTIEDAAELRLPGTHVIRLEARAANAEGVGAVSIRDLVRAALRLRPDRIVVGEVRGPEALDMVWAMSSGHDGSMSTVHADSARDALLRLETFVLMAEGGLPVAAVRAQLHAAIDLLVGVRRTVAGERIVATVDEPCETDGGFGVRPVVRGGQFVGRLRRPARGRIR